MGITPEDDYDEEDDGYDGDDEGDEEDDGYDDEEDEDGEGVRPEGMPHD